MVDTCFRCSLSLSFTAIALWCNVFDDILHSWNCTIQIPKHMCKTKVSHSQLLLDWLMESKKNNSLQKTLSISHLETMQIPFNKASPGSRLWPETSLTLMDCAAQFILDEPGTHLKTIGFSHHIIAWHLAKKSRRFPPWGPWGWRNHQWQTNMLYITLRSSTLW